MGGIFKTRKTSTTAERLSDFKINAASYGETVPVVLGTTQISGNTIDWYDFEAIAHTTTTRTGKGGGSKTSNTEWTYKVTTLIGLCEGPIAGVGTVWKDKEVYQNGLSSIGMTLFNGSYGQAPWVYTQSKHPEKALPYSGLAYVAGVMDLGSSNGLPTLKFELKGLLLNTGDGTDVDPAAAINYIMSNSYNGVNLGDTINSSSLDRLSTYAKATDLLISTPSDSMEKKAYEIINDFCTALDTMVFLSQRKLKFVPLCMDTISAYGVTYEPNTTVLYDLTEDDFLENNEGKLVVFERTPDTEAYNQYTIEFINRTNSYESESVYEPIDADVNKRGLRPADSLTMHFLHTKARASYVARNKALNSLTRRNRYTFKLDACFCLLEPGDLLTITCTALGLNKQPVIVETWEESDEWEIELTVFSIPRGNYSTGIYDVHEAERGFINFNVAPGNTSAILFQPPSDLTDMGLETWIAASGGDNWGGCNVWVSDDGDAYQYLGKINGPSRMGKLTATLPLGNAIDTTNALSVVLTGGDQMLSGTQQDAQNLNTLCWVDGELIAYETATLTEEKQYELSYLVRGAYNTEIANHAVESKFVRLDQALFKYPFAKEQIGKVVYLKLTSFNVYGSNEQALEDVEAYAHVLSDVYVPQVTDLKLVQHLREVRDGTNLYELEASWIPPSTLLYEYSDVYLKTSQPNWDEIETSWDELEDSTLDDMTNANVWKYIGKSHDSIVIPGCATGQTFTVKVVASTQQNFKADFDIAPTVSHEIKIKSYTPATPQNLSVVFTSVCTWSWDDVGDTDNDFYELRLDKSYGDVYNRLARTNANKIAAQPPSRQGTVYLYAHNSSNQYSPAASLEFNKPAPIAPQNITIVDIFQGIVITCDSLPSYCLGINVHVNDGTGDKVYFSPNNNYTFKSTGGIYDIQIAYVDLFGEGAKSTAITKTVKPTIDPALIAAESLSLEMMDGIIKDAVEKAQVSIDETIFTETKNTLIQADANNATAIQQTTANITQAVTDFNGQISEVKQTASGISQTVQANKVTQDGVNTGVANQITQQAGQTTSIITELNKPLDQSNFTSFVQALQAINLRVTSVTFDAALQPNQLVTQINLANGVITLDGKLVHITGNTVIDANVIASGMIQAGAIQAAHIAVGAVTADKISVTSLSAICGTFGTITTTTSNGTTTMTGALATVHDTNGRLRLRWGVW